MSVRSAKARARNKSRQSMRSNRINDMLEAEEMGNWKATGRRGTKGRSPDNLRHNARRQILVYQGDDVYWNAAKTCMFDKMHQGESDDTAYTSCGLSYRSRGDSAAYSTKYGYTPDKGEMTGKRKSYGTDFVKAGDGELGKYLDRQERRPQSRGQELRARSTTVEAQAKGYEWEDVDVERVKGKSQAYSYRRKKRRQPRRFKGDST